MTGPSKVERLGSEKIGKLLLEMSSQTTFSLLVYAVYSITDTYFLSAGINSLAAAFATVAGQSVSAGMSIYFFFFRKDRSYQIRSSFFKPDESIITEVLMIGLPSFLKSVVFQGNMPPQVLFIIASQKSTGKMVSVMSDVKTSSN